MRVWLCTALLLWLLPLVANDIAVVGQGGRVCRLESEHAGVRLVREQIGMDIYHAFYKVHAEFVLRNEGPACTVTLGFPERGLGDVNPEQFRAATGFQQFATWVDNVKSDAKRAYTVRQDASGYTANWVARVTFAAGQVRKVRVQYQSHSGSASNGTRFVSYTFSGGNWKGLVEESVLDATFHIPETFVVEAPAAARDAKNPARFHFVWKRGQVEEAFQLVYASTWPEWLALPAASEEQPFTANVITMTQPGRIPELDWIPPAVVRDGVTYLGFEVLQRYLREQHVSPYITTSWDPATNATVLQVGARKLNFRLKSTALVVEEGETKTTVTLPAAPFMSNPGLAVTGKVFVPAAATIQALGGTIAVDGKAHRMTITLPTQVN